MKDFLGNRLKPDDVVAFTRPFGSKLTKGYIVQSQNDKVKVRFWVGDEWDTVVVERNRVIKVHESLA